MTQPDRIIPPDWMTAAPTRSLLAALSAGDAPVRFVGGCVRDAILGLHPEDVDVATPETPDVALEVQLFIDEKLVASKLAGEERRDLVSSGITSNPNHGFSFDLTRINTAPGRHTAQVYALRPAAGATKVLLPVSRPPRVFEVGH